MKDKTCKLCGENCRRRSICLAHKEAYPYIASPSGNMPFDRSVLMGKANKKKIKRVNFLGPEELIKEVKK